MKYIITKSSVWDKSEKPCEEAEKKEKFKTGIITTETFWTIEIKDFKDIEKLVKKYHRVIISDKYYNCYIIEDDDDPIPIPAIEIYDDYRE